MKRYVIIGNGAAGASAAEQIRKIDKDGSITVFTCERHPFYYRPRLPDYIAGAALLSGFTMHPLSKYREWNVDLRLGEKITSIDPSKKEVSGEKSGKTPYDELLLALGSSCLVPPVAGSGKKGIYTLRTIDDADALKAAAEKSKTAILIGGGLLGLEAGHALAALGCKLEVVESMGRLLPRQLDERSALILRGQLEQAGFVFHLGATVQEISGSDTATGLVLAGGKRIDGDLVLFSAGVRPNLELARSAGLAMDHAVKVDQYMRTSVSGIWAAGDLVEFDGQCRGLWPIAMNQGKVAGASMAGNLSPYVPQSPGTSLKVAGIDLISAGNIDAENSMESKCFIRGNVYRKIVLEKDVIKGVIFLGITKGANKCVAAMNEGRHLGALAEKLGKEDFDFSAL